MPRHTRATGFSPGGPQQLDEHGHPEQQTNKRQTRKQTRVATIQESETQDEPTTVTEEPKQVAEKSRPRGRATRAKRDTKRSVTRSASPPASRKEPANRRARSPRERKPRRGRSKTTTPEPPPQPQKSPSPEIEDPAPEPVPESIQENVAEASLDEPALPEINDTPYIRDTPNINTLAKLAVTSKEIDKAPSECGSEEGVQVAAQWLADDNTRGPSMTPPQTHFASLSSVYASSPPAFTLPGIYFMGQRLTNYAIIDALSASLRWFKNHPEAPIPNDTEMEQLLENFANPPAQLSPPHTLPPLMSGGLGTTTSEPATPPTQSSSSVLLRDTSPSQSTSTPQNPDQTSSWANALSVPSFIRTPFSKLTSSIFGRRPVPATEGRLPRPNFSTESRVSSTPITTPRPPHAADAARRVPATISHPAAKRARVSEHAFIERPSQATPSNGKSTLTGANENHQLPVHLRGVRYQDLPPEYQALVPHLKPSNAEDNLFGEGDDELDRILERRRIKSAKRNPRRNIEINIDNERIGEEHTSITDSRVRTIFKNPIDLTQHVNEETISTSNNHNDEPTFSTTPVIGQKRKKWITRPKTFSGKIGESTYGLPENIYDSSDEECVEVTMTESSINGATPTSNSKSRNVDGSPTPKAKGQTKKTPRSRMPGQFESDTSFQSSNEDLDTRPSSSPAKQVQERDEFGLPIVDSKQNPMLADFWDRQRKFYQGEKAKGRALSLAGPGSPVKDNPNFASYRRSFNPRSPTRRSGIGSQVPPKSPSTFESSTAKIRQEQRRARETEAEGEEDPDYNRYGDPHRARPYVGDLAPGGRFPVRDPEAEGKARNIFDTHGIMEETTIEIRKSPTNHTSDTSRSTPLKRKRSDGHPAPGKWVVPESDTDSESEEEVEITPRPRSATRRTNQEWLERHPEEPYWDAEKAANGDYVRKLGYKEFFPDGPRIDIEGLSDELKEAIAWKHFAVQNPKQKHIFDGKIDYARAERLENLYAAYSQEMAEKRAALLEKAQATAPKSGPPTFNQSPLSPSKTSALPSATTIDPAHQEKLDRMRAAAEQHKPKTPSRLREAQIMSPGSTHSSLPSPIPAVSALTNPLRQEYQLQPINGEQFKAIIADDLRNDLAALDTEVQESVLALVDGGLFSPPSRDTSGDTMMLTKYTVGDEENIPPTGDDWAGFDDEVSRAMDEVFGVVTVS